MGAKKAKKKNIAAAAVAGDGGGSVNPCTDGGQTMQPWIIDVRAGESLRMDLWGCSANVDMRLRLEAIPFGPPVTLFNTQGQSHAFAELPPLPPGRYSLFWDLVTPSQNWQTRAQLQVGDTVRFHRKKTYTDGRMENASVFLDVRS